MKKQTIRLNESQLQRVIKESIKCTLNEGGRRTFGNTKRNNYYKAEWLYSKFVDLEKVLEDIVRVLEKGYLDDYNGQAMDMHTCACQMKDIMERYNIISNFSPDEYYTN